MDVIATVSFVGRDANGVKYVVKKDDEFVLPPGVDWLSANLVREKTNSAEPAADAAPKRRSRSKKSE